MTSDRGIRLSLGGAAYLMAASLAVVPLLDAALAVWPARFADITWRYGMVGIVTQDLTLPLVGIALAIGLALKFEHVALLRTLAVVGALGVTLLLIVLPLFLLDAIEMRAALAEELRAPYDVATLTAVLKMSVVAVFGACIAIGGLSARASREGARRSSGQVVVGRTRPGARAHSKREAREP